MQWVSLVGDTAQMRRSIADASAAEIRLDLCRISGADLHHFITGTDIPLLISHHEDVPHLVPVALAAGIDLLDLPCGPSGLDEGLRDAAHAVGTRVIASYHDLAGTPSAGELRAIVERGFAAGADIVKVACLTRHPREAARMMALMDDDRPVVAIGMGHAGRITRVAGQIWDSPLVFVAPDATARTAPGQFTAQELTAVATAVRELP